MNFVVPPSTENTSKTKTPTLSEKSALTVDESDKETSSFGLFIPVRVTVCVDTPFVSIIRIEAYTFVDASSSNGKFVNVKVVLPLVVSVVTLPSAKLQATLPETEPFATMF